MKNLTPVPPEQFKRNIQRGIFWITSCIALGPYVDEERGKELLEDDVTHLLNVSTSCTNWENMQIEGESQFTEVVWQKIEDLKRLDDELTLYCLDTIHRMLSISHSKLYIHCVAGQNRSPTILWLYLIACGVPLDLAGEMISRATMDAIPGHPALIDRELIDLVVAYGKENFLPLSRLEIIQPV